MKHYVKNRETLIPRQKSFAYKRPRLTLCCAVWELTDGFEIVRWLYHHSILFATNQFADGIIKVNKRMLKKRSKMFSKGNKK